MSAKRLTPAQLASRLRPGQTVFVPGSSAEPVAFLEALAANADHGRGVHFVTNCIPGINEFDFLDRYPDSTLTCFFMQSRLRRYAESARLRYVPLTYYEIDDYLRTQVTLDLAIVPVAPPDAQGRCSLGNGVDFSLTALARAATRVALINEQLPATPHAPTLDLADCGLIVSSDYAPRFAATPAGDVTGERIAAHVAALIRDGDTLQMGIGKLPAQVLRALRSHRGLRIHSGIVAQEVQELFAVGAMDRTRRVVCTSFSADAAFLRRQEFRDWLELQPVSHTHHPATLAGIEQLVAINSALEVDLRGNVNAEVAGGRAISGPGGMPDFALAAHRAARGRSVIALPATTPDGRHSRIVADLGPGARTTLTRSVVDHVVTEFGAASLRGRTEHERALALIGIAHPDFRDALAGRLAESYK